MSTIEDLTNLVFGKNAAKDPKITSYDHGNNLLSARKQKVE